MSNNKFPVSAEELDLAFKQPVVNEAKQVVDEVGKALEVGASAQPQDPQAQAQKQQKKQEEDQKTNRAKQYWNDFFNRLKANEQREKQFKMQSQQKVQEEQQEQKQKVEIKQFEKVKKQKSFEQQHIEALEAKAEMKKGVGG